MNMSREESEIPCTSVISQLDYNCLSRELDLEQPEYDALTSTASTKDSLRTSSKRHIDWERRNWLRFPFLH